MKPWSPTFCHSFYTKAQGYRKCRNAHRYWPSPRRRTSLQEGDTRKERAHGGQNTKVKNTNDYCFSLHVTSKLCKNLKDFNGLCVLPISSIATVQQVIYACGSACRRPIPYPQYSQRRHGERYPLSAFFGGGGGWSSASCIPFSLVNL